MWINVTLKCGNLFVLAAVVVFMFAFWIFMNMLEGKKMLKNISVHGFLAARGGYRE